MNRNPSIPLLPRRARQGGPVGVAFLAALRLCAATEESPILANLSFEELSNIKVNIASIKDKPIREQPGIVSVVTAQQIQETGARDLMDVLQTVPGFGFGTDVRSAIGPSFRGLWAYEGKTQLLLDGCELNDGLYGDVLLANHLPADVIDTIEIIRGPGSAMYGGTAELAVIRITTKGAAQNGGYGLVTPSYADNRLAVAVNAGVGYTKEDWRYSANVAYSDTYLSNQRFVTLDGRSLDLTDHSPMNPLLFNFSLGWKELEARVIYDRYHYEDQIIHGELADEPTKMAFDTLFASVKYDVQVNDWLKLTPLLKYRLQQPWSEQGDIDFESDVARYSAELNAVADLTDNSSLLTGVRYYLDHARVNEYVWSGIDYRDTYFNGSDSISYHDWAAYAQYDLDSSWANLTLGGRYEHHDYAGGQFVPRLGLTKAWERFHLKLLYNQAFRTPNIGIIADAAGAGSYTTNKLSNETTTAYELEAGYEFDRGVSLVGNLFYMQIEDPIVYDPVGMTLFNGGQVSSYGVETELRIVQPRWSGYLGYSLYLADENQVQIYQSGDADRFLGMPAHKVSFGFTALLGKNLSWNVNGSWLSEKRAYAHPAAGVTDLPGEFLLNTYVEYRWKRCSIGVGLANLMDEERLIAQPYDGVPAPFPSRGGRCSASWA